MKNRCFTSFELLTNKEILNAFVVKFYVTLNKFWKSLKEIFNQFDKFFDEESTGST